MSDSSPSVERFQEPCELRGFGERHPTAAGSRHVIDGLNVVDAREHRLSVDGFPGRCATRADRQADVRRALFDLVRIVRHHFGFGVDAWALRAVLAILAVRGRDRGEVVQVAFRRADSCALVGWFQNMKVPFLKAPFVAASFSTCSG